MGGHLQTWPALDGHVRFAAESGHQSQQPARPLWANRRHRRLSPDIKEAANWSGLNLFCHANFAISEGCRSLC
jgi:hypothetical protein